MPFITQNRDASGTSYFVDGVEVLRLTPIAENDTSARRKLGSVLPNPFPNAAGKIERAREHLEALHQAISGYLDTAQWRIDWAPDPRTMELVFRATMSNPLPSSIEAIIGDDLSNMRSALNLLVSDLVRANGHAVTRQNAFPSAESQQKFLREAPKRLEGLSAKALKFIHRLRPYGGGRGLFWKLSEVRNTDDHHYILPVVLGRLGMAVQAGMPGMFIGPNGNLYLGGGPPGSVPAGYEQGPMSPGNAIATELVPGQAVEFHRGAPGLQQLRFGVGLSFTFMIGPEIGPVDLLHDFYALVSRTIATAQRVLA
jgi:hypothetical protein